MSRDNAVIDHGAFSDLEPLPLSVAYFSDSYRNIFTGDIAPQGEV